mgnify:CR=1 FL=1
MGDDWGRLGRAMGQKGVIRRVGGCRSEGRGNRVRLGQVMMGLEARECGEPVQAQVGQEQAWCVCACGPSGRARATSLTHKLGRSVYGGRLLGSVVVNQDDKEFTFGL